VSVVPRKDRLPKKVPARFLGIGSGRERHNQEGSPSLMTRYDCACDHAEKALRRALSFCKSARSKKLRSSAA
jgi:hypothetical protein